MATKKTVVPEVKKTLDKIDVRCERKDGKTYFTFNIPSIITDFYKEKMKEIKESEKWAGLKFYTLEQTTSSEYKNLLSRHNLTDSFGRDLIYDGMFNIAWIRTVGGKGKIEIGEGFPYAVLNGHMQNLATFLKSWSEEYVNDYVITASIAVLPKVSHGSTGSAE